MNREQAIAAINEAPIGAEFDVTVRDILVEQATFARDRDHATAERLREDAIHAKNAAETAANTAARSKAYLEAILLERRVRAAGNQLQLDSLLTSALVHELTKLGVKIFTTRFTTTLSLP